MTPLVTLTTDFGTRDPYVAAMKGVLASVAGDVSILDLTHEIAPQHILEGALFLAGAAPYFPEGTIHVAVVDPGVGSARRALAVRAGGQVFVCPDNGLLTLVLRGLPLETARVIAEPAYIREKVSATFHGRDVFAPAAGHLAAGLDVEALGPDAGALVSLNVPEPERTATGIRGTILHVDRFGNLVSNIPRAMLEGRAARVSAGEARGLVLQRTYSDAALGETLALFGSSDHIEIATNGGSAASKLGLGEGDPVEVIFS